MDDSILGCFLKVGFDPNLKAPDLKKMGDLVSSYIWGERGIDNKLEKLKSVDYGEDLKLALFEFYVKPTPVELKYFKEIESYRKKEKAIGIPIIITDENFFNKSEEERYEFLKVSIMQKMDLLEAVIKRRKLDTNMKQLKSDLVKLLSRLP
ncbi:hypothetical protein [Bacteroides faecalis]|uniref:Uncharacterized protein n=1 Tax=Bacteroides faecalis TaxID=2447885 RepID=A0A401LRJ1_9BACE|nr:hypothetical protein [Bacteroides faecalis]GCB34057.1 hypothetical protein KGMB02408_10020 [Bacteroides faecalis]